MATALPGQSHITIFPATNYSFGTKPPKLEKDAHAGARMERLKEKYAREGLRRSVDAVLLVHEHGHPHVLLLQVASAYFRLPGGRLRPGEPEAEGLARKLDAALAPEAAELRPKWEVGELLGTWVRPNFDNLMFPYCPPHVARPKEVRRLFLVRLPERGYLGVPKNHRLLAAPLFEVYDNGARYGPVIAALPAMLARFAVTAAGGPERPLPPAGGTGAGGADAAAAPPAAAAAAGEQQQGLTVTFGGGGGGGGQAAPAAAKEDDVVVDFNEDDL